MLGTFLKTAAVTVATGAGVLLGVALGSDAYEYTREKAVGPRKQEKVAVEVKGADTKKKAKAKKTQARSPAAKLSKHKKAA
jgi:hypothetical protein